MDSENNSRVGNVSLDAAASQKIQTAFDLFDECQRSTHVHKRAVDRFTKECDFETKKCTLEELVNRVVVVGKREVAVERLTSFVTLCCSARQDQNEEAYVGNQVVEYIICYLLKMVGKSDKNVRLNATLWIGEILQVVPNYGMFLCDETWDSLESALTARLNDKIAAVRSYAVLALERLQDHQLCAQGKDPICNKFTTMLSSEGSALVRKALLRAIVITPTTLSSLLQRTRDVKEDVRAVAFEQFARRVPLRKLSISQRVALLKCGLEDRSKVVRQVCEKILCQKWFSSCSGDAVELLRHLDVEANARISHLALCAIFSDEESQDTVGTDFQVNSEVNGVTAEVALFMYARCSTWIEQGMEQNVECLIPDLSFLGDLIQRNTTNTFVLEYLVRLAGVVDSQHDIVGRQNIVSIVTKFLVSKPASSEQDMEDDNAILACFELLRSFYSGDEEDGFIRQGCGIVADCFEPLEGEEEYTCASLSGPPRDQLQRELEKHLKAEDYVSAASVKAEIQQLELSEWRTWRSLALTLNLLKSIRQPRVIPEMQALLDDIIIPNIKQSKVLLRRQVAVRCLGLYGTLDAEQARASIPNFLLFLGTEEENVAVRADSLRAIFDLIMIWGLDGIVPMEEEDEKINEILIELLEYMESPDKELSSVAAEGFAKLALVGRLVEPQILQCLLVLYFHPSSQDKLLRQCLAVFFPSLVEKTQAGRKAVEEISVPVLCTLLHPTDADSPLHEISVEPVLLYLIELLSQSDIAVHLRIAEAILIEIIVDPEGGHIKALLRGLELLSVEDCEPGQLENTRALTGHIARTTSFREDNPVTVVRLFDKWQKRIGDTGELSEELNDRIQARRLQIENCEVKASDTKSTRHKKVKQKKTKPRRKLHQNKTTCTDTEEEQNDSDGYFSCGTDKST